MWLGSNEVSPQTAETGGSLRSTPATHPREWFFQRAVSGFQVTVLERAINNPRWGPDNWIYVAAGGGGGEISGPRLAEPVRIGHTDFRFKPDGSAIEPVTGRTGTFGLTQSDFGDRFLVAGLPLWSGALHVSSVVRDFLERQGFVVVDGGLATELEALGHDLDHPLWSARLLNSEPAAIRSIHQSYLEAGADCLITAGYQASIPALVAQGLTAKEAERIIALSVTLACEARDAFLSSSKRDAIQTQRPDRQEDHRRQRPRPGRYRRRRAGGSPARQHAFRHKRQFFGRQEEARRIRSC